MCVPSVYTYFFRFLISLTLWNKIFFLNGTKYCRMIETFEKTNFFINSRIFKIDFVCITVQYGSPFNSLTNKSTKNIILQLFPFDNKTIWTEYVNLFYLDPGIFSIKTNFSQTFLTLTMSYLQYISIESTQTFFLYSKNMHSCRNRVILM